MANIDTKLEAWKKQLLDLGKRNRLINFKETKRSNITITKPGLVDVYQSIVLNEKTLRFPFPKKVSFDEEGEEIIESVIEGDFETNKTINELQKTLKALRLKAKTSIEEQGINTLYLTFGLIKWTEANFSSQIISSPIILVPVSLTIESISSPFVLQLQEDEIVINPTLLHKFEHDFGLELPEFDALETNINEYLQNIRKITEDKSWQVVPDVNLTILSFLKINMYKDLEKSKDKIVGNLIISAISGDGDFISVPNEFNNFDHDKFIRPIDSYQVVDADSSQQDAILLAKKGISFVLQGPPGTGKSQTITNIISESLASGKKVLFVSEKMAALQVVHKRLTQVGLNDFCLTLHSHKANKKEILKELYNTINLNKIKVHDEAIYQLNTLQQKRDKLNAYSAELHAVCKPLNKTIYEINGKLAALSNTPEVIFTFDNIETVSAEKLIKYIYLLDEFSKTIGKMSEDFTTNPWRNSNVKAITHELRHDIESISKKLIPKLKEIGVIYDDTIRDLQFEIPISFDNIQKLADILCLSGLSPKMPIDWVMNDDNSFLNAQAEKYKTLQEQYNAYFNELAANYHAPLFDLIGEELKNSVELSVGELSKLLNPATYQSSDTIVNSISDFINDSNSIILTLNSVQQKGNELATFIGIEEPETILSIENLQTLLGLVIQNPKPTNVWLSHSIIEVLDFYNYAKELHNELKNSIAEINKQYDKEIFEIDFDSMLKRFRTEYKSFFKYFKHSYKADKKHILSFTTTVNKNTDASIISLLETLKLIKEKKDAISTNKEKLEQYFGVHYNGEHTDWNKLFLSIDTYKQISTYFASKPLPKELQRLLLSNESDSDYLKSAISILNSLSDGSILRRLQTLLNDIGNTTSLKLVSANFQKILKYADVIQRDYYNFTKLSKRQIDYETALKDLSTLFKLQLILNEFAAKNDELKTQFSFLFKGINTQWEQVFKTLSYASEFKSVVKNYSLPHSFVKSICEDEKSIAIIKKRGQIIFEKSKELIKEFNWFAGLFEETEKLNSLNLYKVIERTEKCLNSISLLEEWNDFKSNRANCIANGLSSYVETIEQTKIKADVITKTFLKRFYRLWLDATMQNYPSVISFRRNSFETTIEEFRILDTSQLKIARSRVKERLISNLPDLSISTASRDEVGVLKRELNKQRKLLPLRKLFNAIPNLLTSLKPCLMMSPLSVSVFLEADSYNFDVVIFDEASQVRTEDAIGAIMRGKQVIIVGDNRQLPPTNFFATTNSNDDFDDESDDENDDTNAYESILDEALKSIPERSLKWHYRSRHEHLIAFSNAKIYNYELITFPSNIDRIKDHGVEYIYVQNGVYDRGGKRNNINEAKRIAELVFEHIKKHPTRSLGIVTFSEAQQLAVDSAINQLRLSNPQYEHFFSEEKEEAFFIKNLENVQGDERDTIIFSIGYAKDANGIMYMNFGPLGKPGGHRRLNVAITRAKYNIKLVGSIHPTDISLEKTNAEGVKLLRSYIDFAINGASTLENELKYSASIDLESPFEVSVYDFLVAKGYNVTTQVGCSGFRIDMAVKHPTLSGVFVLGIECDGATYHSSRTARERDRLRQTVLEDIGWKIYRIWSTDWIKDPIHEGEKLYTTVENALSHFSENSLSFKDKQTDYNNASFFSSIEAEIENETLSEKSNGNKYGFIEYIETDITTVERHNNSNVYISNVVKSVVQNEYPIHIENLCKRIAPLFGYQKATQKVKTTVSSIINRHLNDDIVKEGDFFSPMNENKIFVRIPKEKSDNIRPINYISVRELSEAMLCVARKSYGIKPDDLCVKTAREFGFYRTGANIIQAFQEAYTDLHKKGKVKEVDDRKVVVI